MKKLIISVLMVFALAAVSCSAPKIDEATGKKVFDRVIELGKEKGKKCTGAFMDQSLHKQALKEANVSERSWANFMKKEGKQQTTKWLTACMLAK